ncbi:hypothetical protein VaNZ11_005025, partial [Volvox africanus]
RGSSGGRGMGDKGHSRPKPSAAERNPDSDGDHRVLASVTFNSGAGVQQGFPLGACGPGPGTAGAAGGHGAHGGRVTYGGYARIGGDGSNVQGVTTAALATAAPPVKRPRHKSEDGIGYSPSPGSNNYAFLIVMYQAWRREKRRQWEKDDLMAVAQSSGLAEKRIYGAKDLSIPGKASNFYDGWSCFRGLINRDPPLASERTKSKGTRGKEFTLTNLGWALAARLYKSALRYREVQPLPGVTEEQVDEEIRRYCEIEEVPPIFQAYPNGTPTRALRGPAYKGFIPGPREDRQVGATTAARTLEQGGGSAPPAAAAAARTPEPSLRRSKRLTSDSSGITIDEEVDRRGCGGGGGGELFGSHGQMGLMDGQGFMGRPVARDVAGAPALAVHYGQGTATGGCGGESGGASKQAAQPAAAAAASTSPVQVRRATTSVNLVAAEAVGRAAAATQLWSKPADGSRAVDVINLLDSSDDDDEGEGAGAGASHGDNRTVINNGKRGAPADGSGDAKDLIHGSDPAELHTSPAFNLNDLLRPSQDMLLQQEERLFPSQPASQPLPGIGAVAMAAAGMKTSQRVTIKEGDIAKLLAMGFPREALRREGGDLPSALESLDGGTISPVGDTESGDEEGVDEAVKGRTRNLAAASQGVVAIRGGAVPPAVAVPARPAAAAAAGVESIDGERSRGKGAKRAAEGAVTHPVAGAVVNAPAHQDSLLEYLPGLRCDSGQQAGGSQQQQQPFGMGSQQQSYGVLGSQQPYGGAASQQPYRVGTGSQQLELLGGQQAGGSGNLGTEGEAADGSDDRTLLLYEWLLPRVSDVTANHKELPLRLPPMRPGQRFEDIYDVVLLADNREPPALLDALWRQATVQGVRMVAGMSLTVGDFLWVAVSKGASLSRAGKEQWFVLDAILERKQVNDLLSSLHSSRYGTQKYRLKRCGLRRLYYLLEEPIENYKGGPSDEKALRTTLQSGLLEGFFVIRTLNSDDTARQLCMLTRALERQYRGRMCTSSSACSAAEPSGGSAERQDAADEMLPSYTVWDSSLKKLSQNMKVQAMFGLMLCAVPGLGEERVGRILARYSSPALLWESYKAAMRSAAAAGRDPAVAAEQMLAGEVGSQCSARVYQQLFSKGVPPDQVIGPGR